jgi:hypothetical protein
MFEDLEISCYIHWRNNEFHADDWNTRYHGYMWIERHEEAEQMAKALKLVEKIRTAFPLQPKTFGQYVVLMAAGLGVKECCRERDGRAGTFYSDHEWQFLPLSYIQGWLDEEIDKLRKAHVMEAAA